MESVSTARRKNPSETLDGTLPEIASCNERISEFEVGGVGNTRIEHNLFRDLIDPGNSEIFGTLRVLTWELCTGFPVVHEWFNTHD